MKHLIRPLVLCALLGGCGSDDVFPTTDVQADTTGDTGTTDTTSDAEADALADADVVPDVAEPSGPDLRAYTGDACPLLGAGTNPLESSGQAREVELYLPADVDNVPVLFFWYGAGGSTQTYEWMQDFADAYSVAIVVPRAGPNMIFEWPILASNDPASELVFFDDIVACVAESLPIDTSRIYTSGFSAGGLWSTVLVMHRADVLASAVVYSGGTGSFVQSYETPSARIPLLGMYGGESDVYGGVMNFKDTMTEFMDGLVGDGHLVLACNHDAGHTIPAGAFDWGIEFVLSHQYGDTVSPFETDLPTFLPDYCSYWQ